MQGLVEVAHAVSKERDVTVRQQFGVVLVTPGSVRHAPCELTVRFVDQRDRVEVPEADEDAAEKTKRFEQMRKNFHRGQGSKNTVGKRNRVDPLVRVKR